MNGIKKGFTIIEALIVLFIFAMIMTAFLSTLTLGARYITESKNRLGAISLANQKMEIIRNLNYDDIGVSAGIPNGVIDPDEYVNVNTRNYHVLTDIRYYDNAFDGTEEGGTDSIATDYKVAKVTVKWGEENSSQEAFLVSTFVPPGVETNSGGGTLRINIINSQAVGISGVSVHVENSGTGVDLYTNTDADGTILLPGTPAGSDYEMTISKSGYESVSTLGVDPDSPYDPVTDGHASVVEGALNIKSVLIDLLSDVNISTVDPLGVGVVDLNFNLTGGRILGTKVSDGEPGYNYEQDLFSNGSGNISIGDISPGLYATELIGASDVDYRLFKVDPGDDVDSSKFILDPDAALDINIIVADRSVDSLIATIKDDTDGRVENAQVQLSNTALGYDLTLTTDQYGLVYFPDETMPLENNTYDISVTATGFDEYTGTVTINNLIEESIVLNPSS